MPVSAEGRVEYQKLKQMAALLSFGWFFGVQLDSLEKKATRLKRENERFEGWALLFLEKWHFFWKSGKIGLFCSKSKDIGLFCIFLYK